MLRTLTEDNNGIHAKCKDLTCENLPTFAGTVLPTISSIVERNAADVLSGEKIIVGDGTNKIKDSNIDATSDNINLPLDKGYWINSQPIVYQDNADSSKYKIEVHKAKVNEELQCNSIKSVGADDDITIDANGTGVMRFNTIVNNGCFFGGATGGLGFNWAIKTTFDSAGATDPCVIIGTATESGGSSKIAVIGSNDLQAANWTPIYMQPSVAAGAIVILGDVAPATAIATGAKMYSNGASYNVGQVISESSMIVRKNGANGHILTSGTAPSSAYNHFLQSKTETLAGIDNVCIANWSTDSGTGVSGAGGNFVSYFIHDATNFGFSKMFISVNVDAGTTGELIVSDDTNSGTIATISLTATSIAYPIVHTSFANFTAGAALYSVGINRTSGSGVCEIVAFSIYSG